MAEGLEVTIKYSGVKYDQVATPATASSEFAILKKDLAHLRVHSPSQKNVRRVGGSFILHWPSAGLIPKARGLPDSLHTRWFKLCDNDPEALKLREYLSIESITLVQDGVVIRSTAETKQTSQDASPGTLAERLGSPLPEMVQQSAPVSVQAPPPPVKLSPPVIPPPRIIPTGPRLDRKSPPHLKRRISGAESPPNQTRQKLDTSEAQSTTPVESPNNQPLRITSHPPQTDNPTPQVTTHPEEAHPEGTQPPSSPKLDQPSESAKAGEATAAPPQPTQDDSIITTLFVPAATSTSDPPLAPRPQPEPYQDLPSPPREPNEMTPQQTSAPVTKPIPTRPSHPHSHPSHPHPPTPRPASPYHGSASSGSGDHHARRRDRDVNRLTRELWDTRRHLTAMQAREQVLLNDLDQLGERPPGGGGTERANGASRDELARLEAELKVEKAKRMRAERALSEVERECRAPFVVPALFQAFMSISELSG